MHGLPTTPGAASGAAPAHAFVHSSSPEPLNPPVSQGPSLTLRTDEGVSHRVSNPNGHTDYSSLAAALEPALIAACDGDLSDVEWFKSTWQSGGAATARAKFALTDGRVADVVVKLPVGPAEYLWTTGVEGLNAPEGAHCELRRGCTPRVFAAGMELGGYDLAWLVVEQLQGHPLSHQMDAEGVHEMVGAAVDWYSRAAALRPIAGVEPPKRDWNRVLHRAREALKTADVADHHRWVNAVKHVQRALPQLVERWDARPINTWCHGDLHPGNVMRRAAATDDIGGSRAPRRRREPGDRDGDRRKERRGRCVLIDLALVHAGHWVEDAVYLERLHWGKPELLYGVKPVSAMARQLKERGLYGGEDYATLANIRRVLMGACSPAFLEREGNPRYLRSALEHVERLLPLIV